MQITLNETIGCLDWQKMLLMISPLPPKIEHPHCIDSFGEGSEHYTTMNCNVMFQIEFYMVSLRNLCLYTTSQICMQCHTFLIFLLPVVESIFKSPQSAVLYHHFQLSLEMNHPDV
jgi:hypothetical protein